MLWIELVTLLAVGQFFAMAAIVSKARGRLGVPAPATTGNAEFERHFRAHMNTLEMLVIFLPALWIAARHFAPQWVALVGVLYLVGRHIYFYGYVKAANQRGLGYVLSAVPTAALLIAGAVGILRSWFANGP
ncbi:MAG TPA: MAPEG family protein [Steroidobacteraceae bacterium]|nr:MAPEG family protein [Steroidobacteraceae bacterium]